MRVSAKAEYACAAMLELAVAYARGQTLTVRAIADAQGIPPGFLVQILLQLKGAGYVASTRGAAGGYRLARGPEEISVADVLSVIEGPTEAPTEGGAPALACLRDLWRQVAAAEQRLLSRTTLAQLAERAARPTQEMYYI